MTTRAGGDPLYLNLLDSIESPDWAPSWDLVDSAWDRLTVEPITDLGLFRLAQTSLDLVAVLRGVSLDTVLMESRALHVRKNAGYAGHDQPDPWANFRLSQVFGISPFDGVLVRMSDKYIRTVNLRRNPSNEQVGESLLDTLFDLAAYALIAICLLRESAHT